MDLALDSTRGFEHRDPRWHSSLEVVATVGEVVELTRDYLATLRISQIRKGLMDGSITETL